MDFDQIPANPRKTERVRALGSVNIAELRKAALGLPEAIWQVENAAKLNRFEALGTTQHVTFRMVESFYDWRKSVDGPLWSEWRPLIEPVLAAATADYGYARGAFPRVMLARMAPGGLIQPHHD